jgi:hypothetical protein
MAETAEAELAEATTGVGQFTVALLPGENMVTPLEMVSPKSVELQQQKHPPRRIRLP